MGCFTLRYPPKGVYGGAKNDSDLIVFETKIK